MPRSFAFWSCMLLSSLLLQSSSGEDRATDSASITWNLDNLQKIGGQKATVVGDPKVVKTKNGDAIEFDGQDDGLFLDAHPLAGAKRFTVEVIFRPDADGPAEQRFFHMQQDGSDDRVMFETRLTNDKQWFLDTHIQCGEEGFTLFAEKFKHPVGQWHHAALVVDGDRMRHYVNGVKEMEREISYRPQQQGKTSLGVRINKVFWFKGAIRTARFTKDVVHPDDFLKP